MARSTYIDFPRIDESTLHELLIPLDISMPPNDVNMALVVHTVDGKPGLYKECIPPPTPGPNQVLVKVSHVAQNPTDGRFTLL